MSANQQQKRQSLNLSDENWEALDRLAAETKSLAIVGATQGRPSWRALMRRLATGELVVKQSIDWCECERCGAPRCPACLDQGQRCEACGFELSDSFEEDGQDDQSGEYIHRTHQEASETAPGASSPPSPAANDQQQT